MNEIQKVRATMGAVADQLKTAVRDGDTDTANAIVERVEREHGSAAAAAFERGLHNTSLATKLDG
jgi:hypothetical protein